MNKTKLLSMTFAFLILAACASAAQAQATRTWISGVGDDVNPCSRTAPCKTLAGAISKTAAGGEINAIDAGGYGTITITKSITIDLSEVFGSVLASGTNGIIVNDSSSTTPGSAVVTLRGLDINGVGTGLSGVRVVSGKTVNIENCRIYGFTNFGVSEERTTGGSLFITDTVIRNNTKNDVAIATTSNPGVRAFLENVQLKSSNQAGISVANGNYAAITDSFISGNNSYGIVAFGTGTLVTVKHCNISANQTGIAINNGNPIIRISDLLITQNVTSLIVATGATGQIQSFGDNKIAGNTVENPPTMMIPQQ